ncbi:MAG: hypothetical protein IKE21_03395 [Erysipelotrichaceae bacterium]|nr:hypothetical protein [Erysipelotrichaceae bacterium]
MEDKYTKCGIDKALVEETFGDLQEYERTLKFYLEDEFFEDLPAFLETEDYAMAKDAAKGLYILADELKVFTLYQALLDVYEDLCYEEYKELSLKAAMVTALHKQLQENFR